MRLQTRIRPSLAAALTALCTTSFGLCYLSAAPAQAGAGIAITMENMFVPMGKQVEKVYDGSASISPGVSPRPAGTTPQKDASGNPVKDAQGQEILLPPGGSREIRSGRQTTEWIGLSGFFDLNRNWRLLGGAHTTLIGGWPLLKFDASLAFMLPTSDLIPVQGYVFLGAVPVFSTVPTGATVTTLTATGASLPNQIPSFDFNLQSGLGVDYVWNNSLYATLKLNLYMLSIYGEENNKHLNLYWLPASFSLSAGMGMLF